MNMIEQVARAMDEAQKADLKACLARDGRLGQIADYAFMLGPWDQAAPDHRDTMLKMARAAIEALREPTSEEAHTAWDKFEPFWNHATSPPRLIHPIGSNPGTHWRAMIDVVLAEK